jgi:hypothetical protein
MNEDEERYAAASSAADQSKGDVIGRLRLLRSRANDDLDHEGAVQWDALIELIEVCIWTAPSVRARRAIEQVVEGIVDEVEREEEQPGATKDVSARLWERVWQRFAAWLDGWLRHDPA